LGFEQIDKKGTLPIKPEGEKVAKKIVKAAIPPREITMKSDTTKFKKILRVGLIGLSTITFLLSTYSILFAGKRYWSYPLTPMDRTTISQYFGNYWSGHGYHLGVDVYNLKKFPVYTKVKNARWGYVRYAGPATGYGNVVIIESPREYESSTNPKKWHHPICQVYAHLTNDSYLKATKKKIGQTIDVGWVIGRLAPTSENGGWPVHLHYGTHKGNYGKWVYYGYTSNKAELNNWYEPLNILANY
jgi:murein DD-endopeptidase MepM/ murein hydrolase activator NlpD